MKRILAACIVLKDIVFSVACVFFCRMFSVQCFRLSCILSAVLRCLMFVRWVPPASASGAQLPKPISRLTMLNISKQNEPEQRFPSEEFQVK